MGELEHRALNVRRDYASFFKHGRAAVTWHSKILDKVFHGRLPTRAQIEHEFRLESGQLKKTKALGMSEVFAAY